MVLSDKIKDFDYTRKKRIPFAEMKEAHYHPYYEFYYLLSGERKIFIADTIYTVKKGDLVIIPKGTLHRTTYISNEVHERITLLFSDNFVDGISGILPENDMDKLLKYRLISIPAGRREYVEDIFRKIEKEHAGIDSYSTAMIKQHVWELIIFVLRCLDHPDLSGDFIEIGDEIISSAAKYISTNYSQPISLDFLADKYNMSPSYFSRKFKKCTGFGFKEYMDTIRINEACSLLLETNLSITEISEKCGFSESNYFGDSFKRAKGLSPREYRKTGGVI